MSTPFVQADDGGASNDEEEDMGINMSMDSTPHFDPREEYTTAASATDVDANADLNSGVLVGVGTRSQRHKFLADWGTGGPPVFMGVGTSRAWRPYRQQNRSRNRRCGCTTMGGIRRYAIQ